MRRLLIGFALGAALTFVVLAGLTILTPAYCLPVSEPTVQVVYTSVVQGWVIDRSYDVNNKSWICLHRPLFPHPVTIPAS